MISTDTWLLVAPFVYSNQLDSLSGKGSSRNRPKDKADKDSL